MPTQVQGMDEWPSWTVASWHPVWAANASWVPWARCCTILRPRAGAKARSVTALGTGLCLQTSPALAESLSGLNENTCLAPSSLCMAHRGADTVNRDGGSSWLRSWEGPIHSADPSTQPQPGCCTTAPLPPPAHGTEQCQGTTEGHRGHKGPPDHSGQAQLSEALLAGRPALGAVFKGTKSGAPQSQTLVQV